LGDVATILISYIYIVHHYTITVNAANRPVLNLLQGLMNFSNYVNYVTMADLIMGLIGLGGHG